MLEVFDEYALLDRVDGDYDFLEETIAMLENDAPDLIQQIQTAAAAGDADTMAQTAHTLKSMISNFCADAAEAAAKKVETKGRKKNLTGVKTDIENLKVETNRLKEALNTFLQNNKP
jgi:HPt (histidine-containing phosphotransfer) domain-containing protein